MGQIDPWTFFLDTGLRYVAGQLVTMIVWLPPISLMLGTVAYLHARWGKAKK